MSEHDAELVLGGRYQVMPVLAVRAHAGASELSLVFLDVWDTGRKGLSSVRLLPDEARELARRLVEAAHTAEQASQR